METITPIASVAYVGLWVTRLLHSTKSVLAEKQTKIGVFLMQKPSSYVLESHAQFYDHITSTARKSGDEGFNLIEE